jgi:hypothetical protein
MEPIQVVANPLDKAGQLGGWHLRRRRHPYTATRTSANYGDHVLPIGMDRSAGAVCFLPRSC